MFVKLSDDEYVNPEHVELIYLNGNNAVVLLLRSGRRHLILNTTVQNVVWTLENEV